MAAKATDGAGAGAGAGYTDLASLLIDKTDAAKHLEAAQTTRSNRETEIARLTGELAKEGITAERRDKLEERIDKEKDLLAWLQHWQMAVRLANGAFLCAPSPFPPCFWRPTLPPFCLFSRLPVHFACTAVLCVRLSPLSTISSLQSDGH